MDRGEGAQSGSSGTQGRAARARLEETRVGSMTFDTRDLQELWRSQRPPEGRRACLTEEDWPRLMAGEMTAAERTRAAAHFTTCRACADEYRALHALRQQTAPPRSIGPSRLALPWLSRMSPAQSVLARAAAAVIVIAHGVTLLSRPSSPRHEAARV